MNLPGAGGQSNLFGASASTGSLATTVMSINHIQNEFKAYVQTINNYTCVFDVAIIRLYDIFDSMKNLPLMKRFDGQLRIYFNTGAVASYIDSTQGLGAMVTSGSSNTFTNTCPILQSCIGTGATTAAYGAAGCIGIVSGLGISTAPITNLFGINLSSSTAKHPMPLCRV